MKNFLVTSKASSVAIGRLTSKNIGRISPKKIIKKGKEHPVAKAQIVPKNICTLSFASACLNKDKIELTLAFSAGS